MGRFLRVWLWLDTAYLASPAELVGGSVWKESGSEMRAVLCVLWLSCLTVSTESGGGNSTVAQETGATPDIITQVTNCKDFKECEVCVGKEGCYFLQDDDGDESLCLRIQDDRPEEFHWRESHTVLDCAAGGVDPDLPTTTTPLPNTTTQSNSTTTTTLAPDTTTSNITTTAATTTTTTTITTTTTAYTTAPTTTTTTTTPSPNSTQSTSTTNVPSSNTSRGHFDGWSFFGGILLTLGLAAIGLVGFKYYRLRSGTGGNYNRF